MKTWRVLSALFLSADALLWGAWAAGQILRDRTLGTALLFYIPSPLVAATFLAAALGLLVGRRRRAALAALAMALVPGFFVAAIENRWARPAIEPPSARTLRLVHWNVWWGSLGWEKILDELRRDRADIYVISEPPRRPAEEIAAALGEGSGFARARPMERHASSVRGYAGLILEAGELAVFARGNLREERRIANGGGRIFSLLRWQHEGASLSILAVDIEAYPNRPRDPILQDLRRVLEETRPDIAAGDFNAPRRSRGLSPLPAGFVHAYEAAGSGWSYTWPLPIPLLAIDQCILGPRIAPIRFALRSRLASDHRRQILDFTIRPPADP